MWIQGCPWHIDWGKTKYHPRGPFPWEKKEDPLEDVLNTLEDHTEDIADLKDLVDKQKDLIADLEKRLEQLETKTEEQASLIDNQKKDLDAVQIYNKERKEDLENTFKQFSQRELDQEKNILNLKDILNSIVTDIGQLRIGLESAKIKSEEDNSEIVIRLGSIRREVEELKEKTWELDTNTRNNLVFYGIREDAGGGNLEFCVKEVIRKLMQISRDMPLVKVVKNTDQDVKGTKPITAQFEKYQDKVAVMQKAKLLKGTGILLSEDFPKRIKEKRSQLLKFAKEVKKRRPDTRLCLQYDKLYVNNTAYLYNEETEEIEMLPNDIETDSPSPAKNPNTIKKKISPYASSVSQRKSKITKSISQDGDLYLLSSPSKQFTGFLGDEGLLEDDSDSLNSLEGVLGITTS
ncbi:uncharacterized protein LOC111706351 isoform X1 [Eurytemora carolleeae]|uniref:uncharacterized protein LOC111706351 isoform X1 n=1 Tax=Eurytemora carolleeae TaxID=1294199 RepID=UPI000C77F5F6|nr:uncharacterized protein LOC111706351 isoform X1 [Eurytemora carolleeae]|eukprot:XP_023334977.1 uncharacterized protein LOC111706351 isoform X1 [Eurytemora affinis]